MRNAQLEDLVVTHKKSAVGSLGHSLKIAVICIYPCSIVDRNIPVGGMTILPYVYTHGCICEVPCLQTVTR